MARFILFMLILLLFYAVLRHLIKGIFLQTKGSNRQPDAEELVQDPYCQTYIQKRTAVRKKVAGRHYYFCTQECLRKFLAEKKS
jgi:YHS domain-containing protein